MSDAVEEPDEESDEPMLTNRELRRILEATLETIPDDDAEADGIAMYTHLQTAMIAQLVANGVPIDDLRREIGATDPRAFGRETIAQVQDIIEREANAS